jgi:hypothetical protein
MTSPDPFEHSDVAYVFGALDAAEAAQFETHLAICADCAARVAEARGLTNLFADITIDEVVAKAPETLLPGLLRRAAVARRRQRWLVGGLGGVAAACVAALVVLIWPSTPTSHGTTYRMTALAASPVSATVELAETSSGTSIKLHCVYRGSSTGDPVQYGLVVTDANGNQDPLSSWTLRPGEDQVFPATTALTENQIHEIDVTYQGQAILSVKP